MTLNQVHQERRLLSPYPKLDEEDELDKRARELGLDKVDSDEPQVIESKTFCTCACTW